MPEETIEVVTDEAAAAYTATSQESEYLQLIVELVNELVLEYWAKPRQPVPAKVRLLALEVAGRAIRNPKGLASWTRSVDDASRTERAGGDLSRFGVYLTSAEKALLQGKRRRVRAGTIPISAAHMPALPYRARGRGL